MSGTRRQAVQRAVSPASWTECRYPYRSWTTLSKPSTKAKETWCVVPKKSCVLLSVASCIFLYSSTLRSLCNDAEHWSYNCKLQQKQAQQTLTEVSLKGAVDIHRRKGNIWPILDYQFKQNPDAWLIVGNILQESSYPQTKCAISTLEYVDWNCADDSRSCSPSSWRCNHDSMEGSTERTMSR